MLRGLWTLLVLAVATTLLGIPAGLISMLRRDSDATMRAGRLWSRLLLGCMGARVRYRGLEHARRFPACIFMANHRSSADIPALIPHLPLPTRFVAKNSLFRIPVMGWAMRKGGFIAIDRHDRERAIRSLEHAAQRVRSGRPVLLFPEGTRNRGGSLLPFKKGPFHLALQAGVPVVPVAISGSHEVAPPDSLCVRPGPVEVRFLPPIDVTPFLPDALEPLMRQVRTAIERELESPRPAAEATTALAEAP